jgi:hypothetical protein
MVRASSSEALCVAWMGASEFEARNETNDHSSVEECEGHRDDAATMDKGAA